MTHAPDADLDLIERSVEIDAPVQSVFDLVSRPGWWINEGAIDPQPKATREGDLTAIVLDQWGTFRIRSVQEDRPRFVSFRWVDREDPAASTLVELFVEPRESGVSLRVVESGFSAVGNTREQIAVQTSEHAAGWEAQLDAARRFLTGDQQT